MGENISPDFNLYDYVIGFDFMEFGDRYFRLPYAFFFNDGKPWVPEKISEEQAWKILKGKKYFCNFIYHHPSAHGVREMLFERLNSYKSVISPGNLYNNTGSTKGVSWQEKHQYLRDSKFTIACDSIHYPGFVTEKIVDAFMYHSIPIYYGSTRISEDFNEESFIELSSKESIDELVSQIVELDNNDTLYVEMLMQSPFLNNQKLVDVYKKLERFLFDICNQDLEAAKRRIRYFAADSRENSMKHYYDVMSMIPDVIRRRLK